MVALSSKSLARSAAELDLICQEIDAADGEITEDMIARFDDARLAIAERTDGWIRRLEAAKFMVEALKERKERVVKAHKALEALHARMKDYLKHIMIANPVPFKGTEGTLYLHRNAQAVCYAFQFEDKTFYRTVDRALISMEPSISPYVKEVVIYLLDSEKVKADLKAGIDLTWAQLHQDSHVRTKG